MSFLSIDIRDFIELCKRGGVCATGHSRLVLASACKRHLPNLKLKYESLKFKRRRLDGSFSKEPNNLSDVWSKIDKLMDSEDFKTSLYYLGNYFFAYFALFVLSCII